MSSETTQSALWRGDFGDNYVDRNTASENAIQSRVKAYQEIFGHLGEAQPRSLLEVGCNVGINLRALRQLTDAPLHAVEPNAKARKVLVDEGVLPADRLFDALATDIPLDDGAVELVFTSGVLIHIPPHALEQAYREMHRVSSRYLLTIEYFSPTPETIPYRGETEALFRRDFGGLWLDMFDDLKPVANGFFWKRTTGLDDLTWWLFEKP